MSQLAVLVTWREVTGTEPTMALLHERLARFRLDAVLLGLARVAALLKTWQNQPAFTVDRQLAKQFLPTYFPRIERAYESSTDRVAFTRLNLLFVAKQACVVCNLDGEPVCSPGDVEQILACCLMANDLLLERLPTPADATIDRACSLLPFSNYVPQDTYPTDLARSLLLIEEITPLLANRNDYIDIAAAFKAAAGVTAQHFCELAFSAGVKFITHVEEQLQDPAGALILTSQHFLHTAVPPDDIATFLARLSITTHELHQQSQGTGTPGSDFLLFQRHPLVEFTPGSYLCPDPGFLLDKAGPALYWTLHDAQPPNLRLTLLTYWSAIIERYAQWLFERTYQAHGQFRPSPRFRNGDEAFDAHLLEGSSLIVFEIKASILTAQAKYGFCPDTLRDELHRKAITGEHGERKGVAQLAAHLRRFLDGADLPDIDRSKVKSIYPVLVFLDHSFVSPYMNRLYNEHFDSSSLRRRYRRVVTPLFSLTLEDLENVLPHTHRHQMSAILDSYYHANKNMYGALSHSSVPLISGEQPGNDVVRKRFHRFADDLERRLFPDLQASPRRPEE